MKIGWIGLGNMGLPMSLQIIDKSHEKVIGYDISGAAMQKFAASGGIPSESSEQIFESCDLVFLSMPTNGLVRKYIEEALQYMRPDTVVVDTSSITRETVCDLKEQALEKGIGLIDCPISGGVQGAAEGKLSAMCGGDPDVFEKVLPYIRMFASKVIRMGDYGTGYTAKLINNMIVGVEITLIAEAFALALRDGIDLKVLMDAIKDGAAGSQVLNIKGRKMIDEDYSVSSSVKIHLKDQKNCMELADRLGSKTPLLSISTQILEDMASEGHGDTDVAAVINYYKQEVDDNGQI